MSPSNDGRNTPDSGSFSDVISSGTTYAGNDIPFPDNQDSGPANEPASTPPAPDDRDHQPAEPKPEPGETPPEPKPDFRFKTHEEAEKGYKHIQAKTTRAEQRAAELEAQIKSYDERLKELEKDRVAAQQTQQRDVYRKWLTERNEAAIREIEDLDPSSPTYHRSVAQVWAQVNLDAQAKQEEAQAASAPPAPPQSPAPPPAPEPSPSPEPDVTAIRESVEAAGLDWNDPLFKSYAQVAPADRDLNGQIEWVRNEINKYLASKVTSDRRSQQPMTRSGSGRPDSKSPEAADSEYSLGDVLDGAVDSRRL